MTNAETITRLADRVRHARHMGDDVAEHEATTALEAATNLVTPDEWADLYCQVLGKHRRHG